MRSWCPWPFARHATPSKGWGIFGRAGLFGLGATILGAVLYYAVVAITDFEIGIVAIAIGYMVGYAVRMGARGRGGRRFQVLALVLTYWAVGLAYTPLAFTGMSEQSEAQTAAAEPGPVDSAGKREPAMAHQDEPGGAERSSVRTWADWPIPRVPWPR